MFYGVPRSGKDIIVNDEIKVYVPYGYVYKEKSASKDDGYEFVKPEKRPVGYKDGKLNLSEDFDRNFSLILNRHMRIDSKNKSAWEKSMKDVLLKVSSNIEDTYDPFGGLFSGNMIIGHERIHKVVRENKKIKVGYFTTLHMGALAFTGLVITPKNMYSFTSFPRQGSAPKDQQALEEFLKGVDVVGSSSTSKSSTTKTTSSKTTTSKTTTSKSSTSKATSSKSKSTTSTEEKNKKEETATAKASEKINPRMLEYKKAAAAKLLKQEEERYEAIKTEYEKLCAEETVEKNSIATDEEIATAKRKVEEINKRIKDVKSSQLDKTIKVNKFIMENDKEIKSLTSKLNDNASEFAMVKAQANKQKNPNKQVMSSMESLKATRMELERKISRLEIDNQSYKLKMQDIDDETELLNRMNVLQLELDTIRLEHMQNMRQYEESAKEFGGKTENYKKYMNSVHTAVKQMKDYCKQLDNEN